MTSAAQIQSVALWPVDMFNHLVDDDLEGDTGNEADTASGEESELELTHRRAP